VAPARRSDGPTETPPPTGGRARQPARTTRAPARTTKATKGKRARQVARWAWELVCRMWRGLRAANAAVVRRLSPRGRRSFLVAKILVVVLAPIWLINLSVAYFGNSVIFPLSPYFLKHKVQALASYALHRPLCFVFGHPETAPVVAKVEARHRLPRGLLAAVVQVESAGRPHRISSAGAMGQGQLMPATARGLGVGDPFDTEANIDGAGRLLAQLLVRYKGRTRLALAAYNAGPGAVRNRVPDNGQTVEYVARVMRVYATTRPRATRPRTRPTGASLASPPARLATAAPM
jgi:soluble lytic murein transglycosylase-like protein